MHFVISTRIALVVAMTFSFPWQRPSKPLRGYKKNSFTTFRRNSGVSCGSNPLIGRAAILRQCRCRRQHCVQPSSVILHPGRHHRTLDQVPLIDL